MRNANIINFPVVCDIPYGADTIGLTVGNVAESIRKRAHQLFEMRDRQVGHELDEWSQAELEMASRFGSAINLLSRFR